MATTAGLWFGICLLVLALIVGAVMKKRRKRKRERNARRDGAGERGYDGVTTRQWRDRGR